MVLGGLAVRTQMRSISLLYQYPKNNWISLDSQRRMLYHDIDYVNMSNETRVCTLSENQEIVIFHIYF